MSKKQVSFKLTPSQIEFLKFLSNNQGLSAGLNKALELANFDDFLRKDKRLLIFQDYSWNGHYKFTTGHPKGPKFNMTEDQFQDISTNFGKDKLYINHVSKYLFSPKDLFHANRIEIVDLVSGEKKHYINKSILKKLIGINMDGIGVQEKSFESSTHS